MWDGLRDIAHALSLKDLVTEKKPSTTHGAPRLTAAIRVYMVDVYRNALVWRAAPKVSHGRYRGA
jgi:hypothetical protein